jgi:diguanylate cyclase (GGDEF)-like protein/PAS domain S-box-containing protein
VATILVVDDRPANREYLVTLLAYKGHELFEAADGAEALEIVRLKKPALVICDILMPTMDGFAFVQQLRSEAPIAKTPVVFCTAHYLEREADDLARSCGVSHVLTKPVEPQLVLDVVAMVLQKPQASAGAGRPAAVAHEHLRLVTDKLSKTADRLHDTNERLAALIELNLRLASEMDAQRLLEQVCLGARQLLGAKYGALGVVDRESFRTTRFVTSGMPTSLAKAFGLPPLDRGILGTVMTSGRACRVTREAMSATAIGLPEGFEASQSMLAAAVASPTGTYGWICMTDKLAGGEFTDDDERLLSILAAQTGRIYENGSLYRKVQLHAAEMEIEIGERIRAEQGLRESERRFSDMLGNVELVSLMLNRDAGITYCNNHLLKLTGWESNEVLGQNWFELFLPPEHRYMKLVFADLVADRPEARHYENEIITRSGERRLIRWNNSVLRAVSGEVTGTASIGEDITDRKRTEQALVTERSLLRTLIDTLPDVVFTKDRDGLFTMCNVAAYAHSGLHGEAQMVGKSVFDLYPGDLARNYDDDDKRTAAGEAVLNREELSMDRTGAKRWFLTNKVPLRGQNGEITGLVGISRDITQRKKDEQHLLDSEARYRQLIDQAADGIFLSDAAGVFVLVNRRGCELLGYTENELIGMNGSMTYVESETAIHTKRMSAVGAGETLRYERFIKRKDGSTFPAEISLKMLENRLVQVIFHDITVRREHELKIARLSRVQAVLSGINSAIVRIKDRDELFTEACRIAAMHGAFKIAWIGVRDADGKVTPAHWAGEGSEFFAGLFQNSAAPPLSPQGAANKAMKEKRTIVSNDITPDANLDIIRREAVARGCRSVCALPLMSEGNVVGVFVLYAAEKNAFDEDEELKLLEELAGDVSFALSFIAQQERVNYLAYYDTLTGLPNRSLFYELVGRQLANASREKNNVTLVLLDIDRFRIVNDTLGRQAGDTLLKGIAQRIKGAVRDQDTVARVGPDTFAISVAGVWQASEIAHLVEARNRLLFDRPFSIGDEKLRVSVATGIAVYPSDADNQDALVLNAEAALRIAKQQNTPLLFYGPEMNAQAAQSLRIENKLRLALENRQFELWYQPKFSLKARRVTGMEALMRWRDPEEGMISPAKFIPIMEQTGMILDAGAWALAQVSRDCERWTQDGMEIPRIAVNVSPLQLRHKDFISKVVEAAERTEQAGGALDLEITESVIMENVDAIIPILQTIRGLGVEIYIDDFGTGYSSLAYIARLPIHSLKIDRSFVVGMTQNQDSLAIVRSVISLAHALRLHVVAEGVETEEQSSMLHTLQCDEVQGYLYGRPVPTNEVSAMVARLNG